MSKLLDNELKLYKETSHICGVDEAGRGPLSGPVVCAAVMFDLNHLISSQSEEIKFMLEKLNDSKKISEKVREKLYPIIIKNASHYSIQEISPKIIDKKNILHASLYGMDLAINDIKKHVQLALIDGNKLPPLNTNICRYVVKGDATYISIAAASILAKVTRDRIMLELDKEFPEYNWKKNKGYPTKEHLVAIDRYGITKYHRLSFGPCSQLSLIF